MSNIYMTEVDWKTVLFFHNNNQLVMKIYETNYPKEYIVNNLNEEMLLPILKEKINNAREYFEELNK